MWRAAAAGLAAIAGYPFYDTGLKFYHADTEENRKCLKAIPSLQVDNFRPTPWLMLGIQQSYYGSSTGKIQEDARDLNLVLFDRELLTLPDGGTISIDWASDSRDLPPTTPVIVMAHGITGGSNSPYIKRTVDICVEHGYRVAVVQQRGINNTPLTTARPACPSATDDLEFGIQSVRRRYPQARLFGMGFSMGANMMLKYAGEVGNRCPLEAISAISCPFDIHLCILNIREPQNWVVDYMLTANSIRLLKANKDMYVTLTHLDIEKALEAKSHYDFDEFFSRRIMGFHSPEHLYHTASSMEALPSITVPVFALNALNDPIIPYSSHRESCLPYSEFQSNPKLILVVTRHGGHLGWFTGLKKPKRVFPTQWYPYPAVEFLDYHRAKTQSCDAA